MSNLYMKEPPTKGKVVLNTTSGDIEVELWSKESPNACRRFVQLCMEKYYNNTIFHRLVKKFIIQGGDPTGTGEGGDDCFDGKKINVETHQRLRFNRRGLVAMHCSDGQVHGSQFFITLNQTPELQGNYTIFGSVVGNTIFNVENMAEGQVEKETLRPICPKKIISTDIIYNPFNDIIPRELKTENLEENDEDSEDENKELLTGPISCTFNSEEDDEPILPKKKKTNAHDHTQYANYSKEQVQIDLDKDRCVVDSQSIVPISKIEDNVDPNKKREMKEKQDEVDRLKKDYINMIKKRTFDDNEEDEDEKPEENVPVEKLTKDRLIAQKLDFMVKKIMNGELEKLFGKQINKTEDEELDGTGLGARVVDPGVYNPDRYDISDPRHPINIRKREGDSNSAQHNLPSKSAKL